MTEIWLDIVGYEGMYQVSNLGRVKSVKFDKERILKQRLSLNHFPMVSLSKNSRVTTFTVQYLVMKHFFPARNGRHTVKHFNGDKSDNRVVNLGYVVEV